MKALIVGAGGQVGRSLIETAPQSAEVIALTSAKLDITDPAQVNRYVAEVRPNILFNAAAYTAVDQAEADEARAHAVNAAAVGYLAKAASDCGARFVHVSTDFVFDGSASTPYAPAAATSPLSAYGRTKLGGELLAGDGALIVRTAWVYAAEGKNFVHTMLRLMRQHPQVKVVADQIGSPTYAPNLAAALWTMASRDIAGTHHYTDCGVASWYDFAVAIQEEALALGLLDSAVPVIPIATEAFPTPAQRPRFSVLDKQSTFDALGAPADHWRTGLRTMLRRVAGAASA